MTVLKPRSRTISVRLSEEEYVALTRMCSVTGARSLSDLTRAAMRELLNGVHKEDVLGDLRDEFRDQVKSLDRKLEELAERVASFKTVAGD